VAKTYIKSNVRCNSWNDTKVNDLDVCVSTGGSSGLESDCLPFRCCRTRSLIPSGRRFRMVVTLSAFALDSASHIDTKSMLHAAVAVVQIMPLDSVQSLQIVSHTANRHRTYAV